MKRHCRTPGCCAPAMQPYDCCRAHVQVTRRNLYRVWAALSQCERATVRELASATALAHTTVRAALIVMERTGIMTHEPYKSRTFHLTERFCWFDGDEECS